jgi:hypothetical protein
VLNFPSTKHSVQIGVTAMTQQSDTNIFGFIRRRTKKKHFYFTLTFLVFYSSAKNTNTERVNVILSTTKLRVFNIYCREFLG